MSGSSCPNHLPIGQGRQSFPPKRKTGSYASLGGSQASRPSATGTLKGHNPASETAAPSSACCTELLGANSELSYTVASTHPYDQGVTCVGLQMQRRVVCAVHLHRRDDIRQGEDTRASASEARLVVRGNAEIKGPFQRLYF